MKLYIFYFLGFTSITDSDIVECQVCGEHIMKDLLERHLKMNQLKECCRAACTGTKSAGTVVIRHLRPEFKFPAKIEMTFSQTLPIR